MSRHTYTGGFAAITERRLIAAEAPNVDVVSIIKTVASSIVEVFLLCLVGYVLARRGIIDARAKKLLNKINVSFFTPALMFSKVAFSLTPEKLADLWIIPVLFVILTVVSYLCAWVLATAMRVSRSQRNFAISASMFMNSNSLPVALMQSLISTVHRDLAWDSEDSKEKELGRALSYLVVFSTLGQIARWSFGVSLLRASDDPTEPSGAAGRSDQRPDGGDAEARASSPLLGDDLDPDHADSTPIRRNGHGHGQRGSNGAPGFRSFPNTPRWRTPATSVRSSDEGSELSGDDEPDDAESIRDRQEWGVSRGRLGDRAKKHQSERSRFQRILAPVRRYGRKIGSFMTPPLYAALLSVIVACIPPVQATLDRFEALRGALKSAGNVSVPLTMVVLGAYFRRTPETDAYEELEPVRPKGERRTIAAAIVARQILTPILLLPVLLAFVIWSRNAVDDDPCFVVVAVLLIGAPPAVTLAQMTAASSAKFERLVSKSLLISYAIVTPPTTIVLVVLGLLIDAEQRRRNGG